MRLPAAIAAIFLLAAPAVAQAQNATVAGGTVTTYTGSPGIDNVAVMVLNPPAPVWVFQRQGTTAALMSPGLNCMHVAPSDGTRISCQITGGVIFNLNAGDDRVLGGADGHGMTFNGGPGSDFISVGGNAFNTLNGDDGNDTLRSVSLNPDTTDGGPGNDTIQFPIGGDDIHGGTGVDTVELSAAAAMSVSLDDAMNDGATGGISFNVHADVENLTGGAEEDTFTGSALANVLTGGQSDDNLVGGGGQDTLNGNEGDDSIDARDGVRDDIDCGPGTDSAIVDPADQVTGCETVSLPDADNDGVTAPQDCNDLVAAIHPGAVDTPGDGIDQDCAGGDAPLPNLDLDLDGALPPADCNDGNAAIRPGATDAPGDGIDQDCSGSDAPVPAAPAINAPVTNRWQVTARSTRVVALAIRGAPAGATVRVTCTGRGCPFKRKIRTAANGRATLTPLFRRSSLRPGAVIEVRITAPGYIGKVVRYTVRRNKIPASRTLCLPPGGSRPRATC